MTQSRVFSGNLPGYTAPAPLGPFAAWPAMSGIAEGLVVGHDETDEVTLWDVTGATPVLLDTVTVTHPNISEWASSATGDVGWLTLDTGTWYICHVTQSGGVLTVTQNDMPDLAGYSVSQNIVAAADGTGLVLKRSGSPSHIQHYGWDGALIFDATMATGGALLAAPRANRFLYQEGFTGDIRLFDETGTELDAITGRTGVAEQYTWRAITSTGKCAYLAGTRTTPPYVDPTYYYRVLNATTDTLSWASAEQEITTDHGNNTYYQWDVWQGQAVWGPADAAGTGSIYWLDMFNGISSSAARVSDTYYVAACGLQASVGFNDDTYSYTVWNVPAGAPGSTERIYWIQPTTGVSTSAEFVNSLAIKATSPGVNNTVGDSYNGTVSVFGADRTPYGKTLHHPLLWSSGGNRFTSGEPALDERASDPAYVAVTKRFRSVPGGNRWGIKCGTPGQRTFLITQKAWDPLFTDPTAPGFIAGAAHGPDDLPRGPITVMFQEDLQLVEADQFEFAILYDNNPGSYSPPDSSFYDANLSVAILNAAGNTVYEHAIDGWDWPGASPDVDEVGNRTSYDLGDGTSAYLIFRFGGPAHGFRITHTNPGGANPYWFALRYVSFATKAPEPPEETIYFELPAEDWLDSGDYSQQFYGKINWTLPDLEPYEKGLIDVLVEVEGSWAANTIGANDAIAIVNGRYLDMVDTSGAGDFGATTGTFRATGSMDLYSGCDISIHSILGSRDSDPAAGTWTVTSAKLIIIFAEGVDISSLGKWEYVSDTLVDTTDWGYV